MTGRRLGYVAGVVAALVVLLLLVFVAIRRQPVSRSPITYDRVTLEIPPEAPRPAPPQHESRPTAWSLEGVVLDPSGQPVEQATVSWFAPEEAGSLCTVALPGRCTTSLRDGRFALEVSNDEPWLVVRHARYRPWSRVMRQVEVTPPVTVVLEPGGVIRGTVVARDHGPVPNVSVTAMATGGSLPSVSTIDSVLWGPQADVHVTQSDSDGRFEFGGLAATEYVLEVCKEGMLRERAFEEHVVVGPGAEVTLHVVPYAYAMFELVDKETGKNVRSVKRLALLPSVPHHDSRMLWHSDLWIGDRTLHSELCGLYTWIVGLRQWPMPAGAAGEVEAITIGYRPTKARVPLYVPWGQRGAEVARVPLEREPDSGVVRLRFTDGDGHNLTNVRVRLVVASETGAWVCNAHLTPAEDGTDEIVLPSGVYQEYESEELARAWDGPPVAVTPGARTDWTLRLRKSYVRLDVTAEVEGMEHFAPMLAAGGVAYLQGARPVRAAMLEDGRVEGFRTPLSEVAAPNGKGWVLGPLDPGTYSFAVDVPGCERGTATVDLKSSQVNEVKVRLRRKK